MTTLGTTLFASTASAGPAQVNRTDHIAFDFGGEPCHNFSANDIMITMHGDWSRPGSFSVWNVTVTNNRNGNAIVSMNASGHVTVDFPKIPPGQSHVMQIVHTFAGDGVVVDFPQRCPSASPGGEVDPDGSVAEQPSGFVGAVP